MSKLSRTKNPLIHNGTSQYERLLQALTPEYFKIDDRSLKDLLHATYQYAECLHYYNGDHQKQGDWQCFWKVEMLTFLAHLSTMDIDTIQQDYEGIKENYRLDIETAEPEELQGKFNEFLLELIEYLRSLALRIDEMILYLPDELPLKQEIIALVEKDTLTDTEQLASELGRLISFHKEAYKKVHDERLSASEYEKFFKDYKDYNKYYWGIPDRTHFDIELDADDSYQRNDQEDLDQLLKKIDQTFRKIKMRANYWFDLNIDTPQLREPHVALFLTFLRLFDHARNSLNNLTKKHLEFYYEKVLCLQSRDAVPDDAHLILELAATVDRHIIEKGTAFVAGKDANGVPLIYQTLEDWFLNQAQVKDIKTTYLDVHGIFRNTKGEQTKRILAAPDVKTAYKDKKEQPNETKDCWRSMGDDADLPDGEIGFAIASPQLILREGRRKIDIQIKTNQTIPRLSKDTFHLKVSSEEKFEYLNLVENLADNINLSGFEFIQKTRFNLANLEAARRLVSDFTADVGTYIPEAAANEDILAIHTLEQREIELLSKNVYYNAYAIISELSFHINNLDDNPNKGELLFYRAYCYWSLAKVYAPPYDENTSAITTKLPKLLNQNQADGNFTVQELYDQIINDLESARALVPSTTENSHAINAYVVITFFGRVLMQMKEWIAASNLFDEVINAGFYSLSNSAENIFTENENPEIIWQYKLGGFQKVDGVADFSMYSWLEESDLVSDERVIAISEKLLNSYEDTDTRRVLLEASERDPIFSDVNQVWGNKYYRLEKSSVIMLRYTEVILNKSLCLLQVGNVEESLRLLNEVRSRASIEPFSENNLENILEERFRELAFEGDRRDILQTTQQKVSVQGIEEDLSWENDRLYFTPPAQESDFDFGTLSKENIVANDLNFHIQLHPDFPPMIKVKEDLLLSSSSEWAILKIELNKNKTQVTEDYLLLREVKIEEITIKVDVSGIRENLIIQNDQGVFNGIQKFYPFGAIPEKGDHFYIGSTEVFQKKLDQLKLNFNWIDPPDFRNHYANYITTFTPPTLNFSALDDSVFPPIARELGRFENLIFLNGELGSLTGEVTDHDNNPLANVQVILKTQDSTDERIFTAETDINGFYTLEVETSGSHTIEFIKANHSIALIDVQPPITTEQFTEVVNAVLVRSINRILVENNRINSAFSFSEVIKERDISEQFFNEYHPTLNRGFVRATLIENDFLHKEYQNSLIRQTTRLAANPNATDIFLPKFPYTPATNGISLDYTSTQTIIGKENKNIDQYYHIYPFDGYKSRSLIPSYSENIEDSELCLLPQYNKPTFKPEKKGQLANGNLYIGLENLKPGSNLSLLIQTKEGSEQNPDVAVPEICWSYLVKDNEWKPLSQSKILKDTTNGLKKTGVFQLTTPREMVSETTLFEGGCYWLRASVVEEIGGGQQEESDDCVAGESTPLHQAAIGLPSIVDIRAQAIKVQFLNQENELGHLALPLPEGTIQQLRISQSAVKGIEQPFASFDGRLPEAGNAFYMRVSERLRHRDRAVAIYDYEHLLLERFPRIQRAKCLNHSKPGSVNVITQKRIEDSELAPGYVTVAVIPKSTGRTGEAATEPRFSKGDLADMEQYLRTKTNLFVAGKDKSGTDYLKVVNPLYEEVQLSFIVQFKTGEDEESRRFDLDNALKSFLSPWLYDENFDITFGRSLNLSKIIHFIEQQSYVDAIADFKVLHCGVEVQYGEIMPTTSRSILTSVIDEDDDPDTTDHLITVGEICETIDASMA